SFDVEHPGTGHAGLYDFDEFLAGNTRACDESEGFGEGVHLQGENRVHGELNGLTGAVGAEMKEFLAHDTEDRLGFFQCFGIPVNHEDELTLSGAPVTVSDRGVEESHAAFSTARGDFAGEGGRHGAGIDIDAAALERFHGAARAPENFLERR